MQRPLLHTYTLEYQIRRFCKYFFVNYVLFYRDQWMCVVGWNFNWNCTYAGKITIYLLLLFSLQSTCLFISDHLRILSSHATSYIYTSGIVSEKWKRLLKIYRPQDGRKFANCWRLFREKMYNWLVHCGTIFIWDLKSIFIHTSVVHIDISSLRFCCILARTKLRFVLFSYFLVSFNGKENCFPKYCKTGNFLFHSFCSFHIRQVKVKQKWQPFFSYYQYSV